MWTATADILRFDEAIAWFRSRLPLTQADLDGLDAEARKRAWTIAGVEQLDVVQDVWDEIGSSIEKGTPYEEFRTVALDKLTKAWGAPNAPRVETIYRNAVQSSYNRGRYEQMRDPEVLSLRPFWMFDAVLDSRTSPVCKKLDPPGGPPTILPADDPFWDTHTPPLHHRCRSGLRCLRRTDAERSGILRKAPAVPADPGFGRAPGNGEWEPDESKVAKPLRKAQSARVNRAPPQPLAAGTHFGSLTADLSQADLGFVQMGVTKARLTEFLARKPLNVLGFVAKDQPGFMMGYGVSGSYWPRLQNLAVKTRRRADSYGDPWDPGASWSISKTAADRRTALQTTFVHELGHHVHFTAGTEIDRLVRAAYADPKAKPITRYASTAHEEYFAESFTAWVYHRGDLRRHDPVGYKMVRQVLEAQGVL